MKHLIIFNQILRVQDNSLLIEALKGDHVMGYYAMDQQPIALYSHSFKAESQAARKFEWEALTDLDDQLHSLGVSLTIGSEDPGECIAFIKEHQIDHVFAIDPGPSYEKDYLKKIRKATGADIEWTFGYDHLLFDPRDLPFKWEALPEVFTAFRKKVEKYSTPKKPSLLIEYNTQSHKLSRSSAIPTLSSLGYSENFIPDPRSSHPFKGGEGAAWDRIQNYFWQTRQLARYKETRNGLVGSSFSSKLSAYLALGCLSPRSVFAEVKRFEKQIVANENTYWLIFELLWREYFKLIGYKHGHKIFKLGGILETSYPWGKDPNLFDSWIKGETSDDFVNAAMTELAVTGWMSNRARQNAGSFWSKTLKQDWRIGALYFQSQLIDYDVQVNWGNWCYVSGVGNDPRDRVFNTQRQAQMYDPDHKYRRLWNQ